jgi:16S rRNA (guanine527-N7)-methyltransferase
VSAASKRLCEGAAKILERPLASQEVDSIWNYLDLLESWNRIHRLVGSSDRDWMVDNLILDSLLFLRVVPESARTLLDVGSGAGIPGIPIKIIRPRLSMAMVESRRKRVSFLSTAVRTLGLRETKVLHGRAESLVSERLLFDAVVARCADELEWVLRLGSNLVSPGGVVVVAGPPATTALTAGNWLHIVNPVTGVARNFAVVTSPRPGG